MPRVTLRGVAPPYHKQREIIDYLFRPDPDTVKQVDLCCGRGYGKTCLSIIIAVKALCIDGNQVGLFTEPDWASIEEIFLDSWRKIVPEELYTLVESKRRIDWINGSVLFYGPRNVSGSKAQMRNKYRGRNLTFYIPDEQAVGCDEQQYTNTLLAVRSPSPVRFVFSTSTPMVGAYKRLIMSDRHKVFYGTSKDNPYLPDDFVSMASANMSPEQVRREIYAEFVALEGRIWKNVEPSTPWPNGNLNTTQKRYNPDKPWWVLCDLGGVNGAYVVVQKSEPIYRGVRQFEGSLWTAVADYCPSNDASASRAFDVIDKNFGLQAGHRGPAQVIGGKDIRTGASTDGLDVAYFANKVWSHVPVVAVDERESSKQMLYDCLSTGIYCADGTRRFTVAEEFEELDKHSKRGILQMFEEDEWPPEGERRQSDFLPKGPNNRVQHVRDALLLGSDMMFPPFFGYSKKRAG